MFNYLGSILVFGIFLGIFGGRQGVQLYKGWHAVGMFLLLSPLAYWAGMTYPEHPIFAVILTVAVFSCGTYTGKKIIGLRPIVLIKHHLLHIGRH